MKKIIATLIIITVANACFAGTDPVLEIRVAELENELAELKTSLAPVLAKVEAEQIISKQRNKARSRMRKDSEFYSRDELREIEQLYKAANKQWNAPAGKASMEKLSKDYRKANRTGCALLYFGQRSKGDEQEKYLKEAIEHFSDCFYGNGVQVGAYARYYLAYYYKEAGNEEKSSALFEELAQKFPEAINHKGKRLSSLIEN